VEELMNGFFTKSRIAALAIAVLLVVGLIGFGGTTPTSADGPSPAGAEVVESDDARVTATGEWSAVETPVSSGGSYLASSGAAGDGLTLQFEGSTVEIRYVEHPDFGTMAIEIDNQVIRTVNTQSDYLNLQASQTVDYLSDGEHTLRVYAVEGQIGVDAFVTNPTGDGLDIAAARAADTGSAVVLVGYDSAVTNGRAPLAGAQVMNSLRSHSVEVVRAYENIPFMALSVDAAGLEALRNNPAVSSITEARLDSHNLAFSIPIIGGDAAHDAGYTGEGQVVAVLDTGVETAHPFLDGSVVEEACFSNAVPDYGGTQTACPDGVSQTMFGPGSADPGYCNSIVIPGGDDCDHGTHVAGIAVGRDPGGADATGFTGVAPDAGLIAIQVFTIFSGETCGEDAPPEARCVLTWNLDYVAGLDWIYGLTETGGGTYDNIVSANMSLGGGYYDNVDECDADRPDVLAVSDLLATANVAVVSSSGNSGFKDGMGGPACVSSVVSVGATTTEWSSATAPADQVAFFSNSAPFLDLLAPGFFVQSSVPQGNGGCSICLNEDYAGFAGTSMASPHVAGAWAVVREKYPSMSVADVLQLLKDKGTPVVDDGQVWAGTPFPGNGETYPRLDLRFMAADVTDFVWVNADTDTDIGPLMDGDVINLATLPTENLNVRANTKPDEVGSVKFYLNGSHFRTENVYPYALAGDWLGDYFDWTPPVGTHTLKAVPYTEAWGGGFEGHALEITFEVVYKPVVDSFTWVNADTDSDIGPLMDGDVVNLADLPTEDLNIRANTKPDEVGSVKFYLNGSHFRTENVYPYAFAGDWMGNYFDWTPPVGTHTVKAVPYTGPNGSGDEGVAYEVTFEIIYDPGDPGVAVDSFTWVNADDDSDIGPLEDGDTVSLASLPTVNLNVRANTTGDVESVLFYLNGVPFRMENYEPYAFNGDLSGNYFGWTPPVGTHTIKAVPYTEDSGGGLEGTPYEVTFTITD
jgi:subtilisin family serine protease/phage-related protein